MTRSRELSTLLALLAAAFLVSGIWLALDNPEIDRTSRGDDYTCLAPWDTVLNDADNVPGGEPPPDSADIAARCRDRGQDRFTTALASGGSAVLAAAGAVVLARRGSPIA